MEFLKFSYLAASMPDYWELSFKTSMLSLHNRTICGHIFMEVSDWIPFGLEISCSPRCSSGRLRPECESMVDIIFVKARFFDLFRSQIFRQLVYDCADHFHMSKFLGTDICQCSDYFPVWHCISLGKITHRCGEFAVGTTKLQKHIIYYKAHNSGLYEA